MNKRYYFFIVSFCSTVPASAALTVQPRPAPPLVIPLPALSRPLPHRSSGHPHSPNMARQELRLSRRKCDEEQKKALATTNMHVSLLERLYRALHTEEPQLYEILVGLVRDNEEVCRDNKIWAAHFELDRAKINVLTSKVENLATALQDIKEQANQRKYPESSLVLIAHKATTTLKKIEQ